MITSEEIPSPLTASHCRWWRGKYTVDVLFVLDLYSNRGSRRLINALLFRKSHRIQCQKTITWMNHWTPIMFQWRLICKNKKEKNISLSCKYTDKTSRWSFFSCFIKIMNEKKTWRKPIIDYKYFFKEEEWENFISIKRKERKKRQKSNN